MRSYLFGLAGAVLTSALCASYAHAEDPMLKDAKYYIVNAESGRYLDADKDTLKNDGTKLQLFGNEVGAKGNRQWHIMPLGKGTYAIVNVESERFLDADMNVKDGSKVQLFGKTLDNKMNRQWRIVKADGDNFFIVNAQSELLLDADKATIKMDGTLVHLSGKMRPDAPNTSKWKLVQLK